MAHSMETGRRPQGDVISLVSLAPLPAVPTTKRGGQAGFAK